MSNQKKVFEYIIKHLANINLKTPLFFKERLEFIDYKRYNFTRDYLKDVYENIKDKAVYGSTTAINTAYNLDISKIIESIIENVNYKKTQKIPKWKLKKRPLITPEVIRIKTNSALSFLKNASLPSMRLKRLEEFLEHLIEFPVAQTFAVKEGAISILLNIRASNNDKVTEDVIRTTLAALGHADPPKSSGIRILSIDGGGMRGLAVLQMLQKIEDLTGKKIVDLFDYICGVSTGAIITCSLIPPNNMSMSRIAELYMELSQKVFNQSAVWGTSKLVWSHAYYDTSIWEKFLMDYVGNLHLIESNKDPKCPKIGVVSAIVNHAKVAPFIFRNYGNPCYKPSDYMGSYRHTMFEAVRASAAAPTIFEEFKTGHMLHQDGGIVVNNPAAIALHEARSLWPDEEINCVVSLGTGRYDNCVNEDELEESAKYPSSWKKIFDKILESATDTEGVHRILNDLLPDQTYYRLNPHLSRVVNMDETDLKALKALEEDTQMFCRRNEEKFIEIAARITEPRSYIKKTKDQLVLELRKANIKL